MNVADTERAATRLKVAGFDLTNSIDEADAVLFNTCSVRARAEAKVYTRIGEVRRKNLLIGVMGCVAQLEGEKIFEHAPSVNIVAGTRATDRLPILLERVLRGEKRVLDLGEREEDEGWNVSPVERRSPHVAFVPIIEGCNKFCSFCIVPYSRGREKSRPAFEIVSEIKKLKESGWREVHLIGQNVNSYRPKTEAGLEEFKGATAFARLLRAVAATGMARIKFTTSFPRDFHPDIVEAIEEHENLCDWVHLPVQSGSDRVLRQMRRGYKTEDYLARVSRIKEARRPLALTTDMIVGFPGETYEEFEETMRLTEQCQFDGMYIFKYSARRGTPAADLPDKVSDAEKRERFLALERLQREIQRKKYEAYTGRMIRVLAEGKSARSQRDLTGHSTCQKVVNFPGGADLIGREVAVRIVAAKNNSLYGEMEATMS
jgi:tRNA-2-methylthio-N6-dimethylallyladenosine synthase